MNCLCKRQGFDEAVALICWVLEILPHGLNAACQSQQIDCHGCNFPLQHKICGGPRLRCVHKRWHCRRWDHSPATANTTTHVVCLLGFGCLSKNVRHLQPFTTLSLLHADHHVMSSSSNCQSSTSTSASTYNFSQQRFIHTKVTFRLSQSVRRNSELWINGNIISSLNGTFGNPASIVQFIDQWSECFP